MTTWRISSYSPDGASCVAVGRGVGVRDSKAPVVHLPLGASAWTAFLVATKSGAFSA